jgi:hypothetical protein
MVEDAVDIHMKPAFPLRRLEIKGKPKGTVRQPGLQPVIGLDQAPALTLLSRGPEVKGWEENGTCCNEKEDPKKTPVLTACIKAIHLTLL